MSGNVIFAARTHVGHVRQVNEDSYVSLPGHGLWVVADGMGGHEAGDIASQMVTDSVSAIDPQLPPADKVRALRTALAEANSAILAEADARGIGSMGATVVALALTEGHFACLWAGDSRLYRLQNGGLEMLTTDHSIVAALVLSGQMTWDEVEAHPHSNQITHAVGVDEELELEKIKGETQSGDRFLLCSDGVNKYAGLSLMEAMMSQGTPDQVADRLVAHALDSGGADNITVIVVDIP